MSGTARDRGPESAGAATSAVDPPALRCAPWARSVGLRPAGSAPTAPAGVVLVEWPLPWPRAVEDVPELSAVAGEARRRGARIFLVDRGHTREDRLLVCAHRPRAVGTGAGSSFAGYEGVERSCRRRDVPSVVRDLLEGGAGAAPASAIDLVICSHGRRDVCCGGAGTVLYKAVRDVVPGGVRVWRSSHQGGHRFAPTVLVLPDGTSWAHLDVEGVLAVVRGEGPVAPVVSHYRGCTGLSDQRVQVLDAVAFREVGWSWLAGPRRGAARDDGWVEVEGAVGSGRWQGVVLPGSDHVVPSCEAGGCDLPGTAYHDWEVHGFREVPW